MTKQPQDASSSKSRRILHNLDFAHSWLSVYKESRQTGMFFQRHGQVATFKNSNSSYRCHSRESGNPPGQALQNPQCARSAAGGLKSAARGWIIRRRGIKIRRRGIGAARIDAAVSAGCGKAAPANRFEAIALGNPLVWRVVPTAQSRDNRMFENGQPRRCQGIRQVTAVFLASSLYTPPILPISFPLRDQGPSAGCHRPPTISYRPYAGRAE
jgi:hypothetical protein